MSINIIFPNQLFEKSLVFNNNYPTFLIEEYLFFNQYNFHKQKILFHRDSMMNYYDFVTENPNMVIVVAMGAYYMVMRLKNM